ncbi:nucleotidyltransferase family protein [Fictibacillus sp. B-59209]|uniref:nucleotidyltransferase family protein n=1 Tax=Fictibacillus sp. B-59209 TaxID=3024873 RepID=UPI002E22CECC|nr:nucleotidyltransferase family protein [Fictibacillus sp. B-59209]
MSLRNQKDVERFLENDPWLMEILKAVKTLQLPDWWVCAGAIRSAIWDALHGFEKKTPLQDVDVIYFDPKHPKESEEKVLEDRLRMLMPEVPWSVKNQARMHVINNLQPYVSSEDAISKFPETPTALGAKLDEQDRLLITAPCGMEDVLAMEVRPTQLFKESREFYAIYEQRLRKKDWTAVWPRVTLYQN